MTLTWRTFLRLSCVSALLGIALVCSGAGAEIAQGKASEPVLQLPIDSFEAEEVSMEEALRLLQRKDYTKILLGFEKVPQWWEGKEQKEISVKLKHTTVGQVLEQLCEADPRYTFEVIDGVLIHVFWKGAKSQPGNLLNIRVSRFSVHESRAPAAIVQLIPEYAKELGQYIEQRKREYYTQKGMVPGGSPGASMRGNMDPEIHLEMQNVTVREVLNAVVLYSRKLYLERGPDSTGWRQPPTSWMYEFIIKPDAPTGLGGIPRWDTLN